MIQSSRKLFLRLARSKVLKAIKKNFILRISIKKFEISSENPISRYFRNNFDKLKIIEDRAPNHAKFLYFRI